MVTYGRRHSGHLEWVPAAGNITFEITFEPTEEFRQWFEDAYLEFYAQDRWEDDGGAGLKATVDALEVGQ